MRPHRILCRPAAMPGGRDVFPCVGAVVSLFTGYDAGYKGLDPALYGVDGTAGPLC